MENKSQIVRRADITKNFCIIPNSIAQSMVLSPNAKSLIIHILSKPDNWYYVKTHFWRETNLGRNAFNKAWKELEEHGFIKSERIMEGNLIRGYNYIISDSPIFGLTDTWINQSVDSPKVGKQIKTDPKKKDITKKEITKKELPIGNSFNNSDHSNPSIAIQFYNEEKMNRTSPIEGEVHHIYSADQFMNQVVNKLNK
jgi:hypothetical protein